MNVFYTLHKNFVDLYCNNYNLYTNSMYIFILTLEYSGKIIIYAFSRSDKL